MPITSKDVSMVPDSSADSNPPPCQNPSSATTSKLDIIRPSDSCTEPRPSLGRVDGGTNHGPLDTSIRESMDQLIASSASKLLARAACVVQQKCISLADRRTTSGRVAVRDNFAVFFYYSDASSLIGCYLSAANLLSV